MIEKHGLDRIAYVCASTLVEYDFDGRFSRDNKEWAKTIPTSESDDERRSVSITSHSAIVNGFINTIRQKKSKKKKEIRRKQDARTGTTAEKGMTVYRHQKVGTH